MRKSAIADRKEHRRMKKRLMLIAGIVLLCTLLTSVAGSVLNFGKSAVRPDTTACDIPKDTDEAVPAFSLMSRARMMPSTNERVNQHRMVQNIIDSGIGAEKTQAISLVAQMLFEESMEAAFIAGVCGNILCEGRIGMFERDWGGGVQAYMPSRMSGDPYNYNAKYGNRLIYKGYSLSKVRKMARDLYYSFDWNKGRYMFGLGCVQWTLGIPAAI